MRSLEGERLMSYFKFNKRGYQLIGSCVVTQQVEQRVVDTIKQENTAMIVFGCISRRIQNEIDKKDNVLIFKTTELNKIFEQGTNEYPGIEKTVPSHFIETVSLCNRQYEDIAMHNHSVLQRIIYKKKSIPFLVIANGCNNTCSYCHTKFFVGKTKSKPIEKIKTEYLELIKGNNTFINIIAEDIGAYGIDINSDLPQLLNELEKITVNKNVHWMLDGLQPKWYLIQKQYLIQLIIKKRISAISVPVQSGSDRIIKLMNRDYKCNEAAACLKEFRVLNPKLYLQGIFIVGFPSETDDDFNDTLSLINEIRFDDVTFIQYSEFDICESSKIKDKVPENVINNRINIGREYLIKIGIKEIR